MTLRSNEMERAYAERVDTRTRRADVGYSSLQELVFMVGQRSSSKYIREAAMVDLICVCGLPLGLFTPSVCGLPLGDYIMLYYSYIYMYIYIYIIQMISRKMYFIKRLCVSLGSVCVNSVWENTSLIPPTPSLLFV